ncbi:hypothetical protein FB451DRAFT_1187371 [Mycena latifolia]|nr:hypothetical protein FB451DRAFT_1187371 [Mycena latifolia]
MGGRTGDANRPYSAKLRAKPSSFRPLITGGSEGSGHGFGEGSNQFYAETLYGLVRAGERGLQRRRTRPASNQCLDYGSIAALSTSTDPCDSSEERTRVWRPDPWRAGLQRRRTFSTFVRRTLSALHLGIYDKCLYCKCTKLHYDSILLALSSARVKHPVVRYVKQQTKGLEREDAAKQNERALANVGGNNIIETHIGKGSDAPHTSYSGAFLPPALTAGSSGGRSSGLKTRPLRVARPGQLYRENKSVDSMKTLVDEGNSNPEPASSASPASFGSYRVEHTY